MIPLSMLGVESETSSMSGDGVRNVENIHIGKNTNNYELSEILTRTVRKPGESQFVKPR